jgi:hypothetical protein
MLPLCEGIQWTIEELVVEATNKEDPVAFPIDVFAINLTKEDG